MPLKASLQIPFIIHNQLFYNRLCERHTRGSCGNEEQHHLLFIFAHQDGLKPTIHCNSKRYLCSVLDMTVS